MTDPQVAEIVGSLSADEREAVIVGDCAMLIGMKPKLLRIAPGWGARELNDLGQRVQAHLTQSGDTINDR